MGEPPSFKESSRSSPQRPLQPTSKEECMGHEDVPAQRRQTSCRSDDEVDPVPAAPTTERARPTVEESAVCSRCQRSQHSTEDPRHWVHESTLCPECAFGEGM